MKSSDRPIYRTPAGPHGGERAGNNVHRLGSAGIPGNGLASSNHAFKPTLEAESHRSEPR